MKWRTAVAGALLALAATAPVHAFVAEVTTTTPVADAEDQAVLRAALEAAVNDVLHAAIAFTPTVVVVTRALVVGDRLYVRLLLVDQDGERAVRDLVGDEAAPPDGDVGADLQL
jgi:hypothetical protein